MGPEPVGTRWVHAEPADRGVQRAPAVTTGLKEAQVSSPTRPQAGDIQEGGPEFDSPHLHHQEQVTDLLLCFVEASVSDPSVRAGSVTASGRPPAAARRAAGARQGTDARSRSSVTVAEAWPSWAWTALTLAPLAMSRLAQVCRRSWKPEPVGEPRPDGCRLEEGLSKREIIRCPKRDVAREVFAALQVPTALADAT